MRSTLGAPTRTVTSPLVIGFVVAGLLMFAVIGVVQQATTDNSSARIETAVGRGVSAVRVPANMPVSDSGFPVFSAQPDSTLVAQTDPTPEWLAYPEWLSYKHGSKRGERLVWAGAWFSCFDLAATGDYVGVDPDATVLWGQLAEAERHDVVATCMMESYADVPLLPTATPVAWLDSVIFGEENVKAVGDGNGHLFTCRHIDPEAMTYASSRTDPALAAWAELAPMRQLDIIKECQK